MFSFHKLFFGLNLIHTIMSSAYPKNPPGAGLNQPISEMVLAPQTTSFLCNGPSAELNASHDEVSVDLTEHHEALIGDEFRNPTNITKQPTLATLGETPFTKDEEEIQHHRIVATEVVNDPLQFDTGDNILQNAIVLLDP